MQLVIDVARLSLWLAILALAFAPLERLFALHGRTTKRALAADLGYFYVNGLLPTLLLAPPLALLAMVMARVTPDAFTGFMGSLPFWAKLVAGLIVSEVGAYWAHRWCHRSPLLWRFHAVHHSIEHLDWLANTRAHPVDIVFTRLCGLAPLYVLGLADASASGTAAMVPVYITLVGTVWSFLVHANVRWRFGALEQVVAMPAFHHWHHTNDEGHRHQNFAAMFPWIDRLFGTLHLPRHWPGTYGVDEPVRGTMRDELIRPFAPATPPRDPASRPAAERAG